LGLAICKKIVDNNNGLISAVGVPNKGSVFTVYLPKKTNLS
jgi:signal transduction histidine kinase